VCASEYLARSVGSHTRFGTNEKRKGFVVVAAEGRGVDATTVNFPCGTAELAESVAELVREAPDYAPKLIKYALNAASVRHLEALCHQLDGELGPADLPQQARALEEQIRAAARKAFAGRAELEAFEPG